MRRAGLVVFSCLIALLLVEGLAQLWVRQVARRGKLFTTDAVLGWRPLPNLDVTRRNANGDDWRVVTNESGWRQPRSTANASRRVIVLGDSYAFGEGVDVEQRFDRLLAIQHPDWQFLNVGVMGFGTDQELLALDATAPRAGDIVLLLTYQNDMIDVLRRRFAGRAKPYYQAFGDSITLHLPRIGLKERLRDKSYLAAVLLAGREKEAADYAASDWKLGLELYYAIIRRQAAELGRRGIPFIVAHHGDSLVARASGLAEPYGQLRSIPGIRATSLDSALAHCAAGPVLLRDGHWNASGHRCAAELIDATLAEAAASTRIE